MERTSTAYKKEMKNLEREAAQIRVRLGVIDLDAYKNATADIGNSDKGTFYSNLTAIPFENGVPLRSYATFERGRMRLDGSQIIASRDNMIEQGFVSGAVSGADGKFSSGPRVIFNFTKTHSCPALTFTFDATTGDYPAEFDIIWRQRGVVQDTITVKPGEDESLPVNGVYIFEYDFRYFDYMEIKFKKTLQPYNRARLQQIVFGAGMVFGNELVSKLSAATDIDPIMRRLEENTLEFTIVNEDGMYDPDKPKGMWEWITQQQPIKVEYGQYLRSKLTWDDVACDNWENMELTTWEALKNGGVTEWVKGGRYVLDGRPDLQGIEATFGARSRLATFEHIYREGKYEKNGKSLYDLAVTLLDKLRDENFLPDINEDEAPYKLDGGLEDIKTTAPLPKAPYRDLLQMIANAAGMIAYTDRDGYIRIEPLDTFNARAGSAPFVMDYSETYPLPEIGKVPPLKEVVANCYRYEPAREAKELHKGEYAASAVGSYYEAEFDFAEDVKAKLVRKLKIRAAGSTAEDKDMTLAVVRQQAPEFITEGFEDGYRKEAYSEFVEARGSAGIKYRKVGGSFPKGLDLNETTGEIKGIPTSGQYKFFTIEAYNGYGSVRKKFSIKINALRRPEVRTSSLPTAQKGVAYKAELDCDGAEPFTYKILEKDEDSKLVGLKIGKTSGLVSFTCTEEGDYDFKVGVSNVAGERSKWISVKVSADKVDAPKIKTTALPDGRIGERYLNSNDEPIYIEVSGVSPFAFEVTSGSLPRGLKLNKKSGRVSGIPQITQNTGCSITVTDGNNKTSTQSYKDITIEAAQPPSWSEKALPDAAAATEYYYKLDVDGSGNKETGNMTFNFVNADGTLSKSWGGWLTINNKGELSGVPSHGHVGINLVEPKKENSGMKMDSVDSVSGGLARFTAKYDGEVILEGKPIETSTTTIHSINMTEEGKTDDDRNEEGVLDGEGEVYELDNPLMTDMGKASGIVTAAQKHLKKRTTYGFEYRGSPEVDALDKLQAQSKYTDAFEGQVLVHKLEFDGALKGRAMVKKLDDIVRGSEEQRKSEE